MFELKERSFPSLFDALAKKEERQLSLTYEFFPQEGKYHADGHRDCHVSLLPEETEKLRGICPKCTESYEVAQDWLIKLGVPPNQLQARDGKVTLHKGKGCANCAGTGYRGRQGI